jgi:hypothetical protein
MRYNDWMGPSEVTRPDAVRWRDVTVGSKTRESLTLKNPNVASKQRRLGADRLRMPA